MKRRGNDVRVEIFINLSSVVGFLLLLLAACFVAVEHGVAFAKFTPYISSILDAFGRCCCFRRSSHFVR